jgi:two-component system LytT family sensor kinase
MMKKWTYLSLFSKEMVFQVALYLLVFFFFSFNKDQPQIEFHQFMFYLNYVVATLIIGYFLLPRFFYRKKYIYFLVGVALVVALVIVVEELVLEKIYFPDTRGKGFPGVFYCLLDVLPVIAILSGFKFAWDALGKQREVDDLKEAIVESELQFLKSQINPHFLFNNLNNLYSYAIENSPKTPVIILELSSVLRYFLYDCKEQLVSLSKEIEQLRNFTQLSELQIEDRGEIHFEAPAVLSHLKIAPLILIVFIENAFKHGQAGQSKDIRIEVEVKVTEEGRLDFYCMNNFKPSESTENAASGIGLENVKKRLQLIYPNAHQLDIRETKNQYEVRLSIELEKAYSK